MDSLIKKLHDNGNTSAADNVEAPVKANKTGSLQMGLCFAPTCKFVLALGSSALLVFFTVKQLPQVPNSQCLLF